jgi:hypothetical protein
MDRSKDIIALAHDPHFHLPFNGELPSNTIHVEILCRTIIELISEKVEFGIYNVADELKTWRHVFDWHTRALGLNDVKGMSSQDSEYLKASFRSESVIRSIATWVRSLPVLDLVRYPGIFDNVFRFLYLIPSAAARRLAVEYKCLEIKRQIEGLKTCYHSAISPVYFSDGMPGLHLTLPSESYRIHAPWDELSEQLRKWYQQYSQPNWLPNSI